MLELKNISYAVPDEKTGEPRYILSDVTLSFPEKSITVITGHNGSGKSTLVKLIMGIERPTSGRVIFNGRDITELSVTDHARAGFTIALQQPVRFKGITVRNLLEAARNSSCTHAEACDILSMVGLCAKDYIDRPVDNTLSGGELKRIELATALAKGGEVFLLDEPEAGIDLWSFDELVSLFDRLREKTVIIVSHQQRILETADKIVLLENDKLISAGRKEEMFAKLTRRPNLCWRNVEEAQNG